MSLTGLASRLLRRDVAVAASFVVAALLLLVLMPAGNAGEGGTDTAMLAQGLVNGLIVALSAAALILVYRTQQVINFAQTALGLIGAAIFLGLVQVGTMPFPLALAVGLAVSVGTAVVFQVVIGLRFARAPRLVLTVFTIAAGLVLTTTAAGEFVTRLPFFSVRDRQVLAAGGGQLVHDALPFAGFQVRLGRLDIPLQFAHVFALATSLALLAGLGVFLYRTRVGTAVRAMAGNPERATLLGIGVGGLSVLVWAIAGLFAGVSASLEGMVTSSSGRSTIEQAYTLLAIALVAALLARMRSIAVAAVAAVLLEEIATSLQYHLPSVAAALPVLYLVLAVVAVFSGGRDLGRADRGGDAGWQATEELRPVPREMRGLAPVVVTRRGAPLLLLAAAVVLPFLLSPSTTSLVSVVAINGIVAVSIVVLTGWAGQVSLGQYGFVAIGALIAGDLVSRTSVPFLVALVIAAAVAAVIAVLVGLPALRIPGLFLAVLTSIFPVAVVAVLFSPALGWLQPGPVVRPTFLFLDFDDERTMYFACVAVLLGAVVLVRNLRRSRFGRVVLAVRSSDVNAQAAGISPARMRLAAFALAGGMAGFAGALLAVQQRGVYAGSFGPDVSETVFLQVILGGVMSPWGALLGVGVTELGTALLAAAGANAAALATVTGPTATLVLLYVAPSGLVGLLARVRDAILRVIAQRRGLVVPSLFSELDPNALRARLVPLGAQRDTAGMALIPTRYRVRSAVHLRPRVETVSSSDAERLATAASSARDEVAS